MAQYGFLIYIYVLMSCLRTLCTQFVRSRQWNKLVAVDGILCTFATLMFYVLYLVGFHWGPTATCWPSSAVTWSACSSSASPAGCGTMWSSRA